MRKFMLAIAMAMVPVFVMASDLTNGLVGYWPFDGNANDYSGNSNHGNTHGVTLTTDRHGNCNSAYHFGGYYSGGFKNIGYITVPNSSSLYNIAESFTIAAWIRIDAWCRTGGDGYDYWASVVCKGRSTCQYRLQIESQTIKAWFVGSHNRINSINIVPSLYCWHHVVVTYDGNKYTAYIDGNVVGSENRKNTISKTAGDLYIGADLEGEEEYFNGSIDEVCIYNRALAASEINALYNGALTICSTHAVTYNANGGTGTMESQTFEEGKEQKLSKNIYRKNGYVFQGWVSNSVERAELAAAGVIAVDYTDEQEITVDSDMTLYAVWANPSLTLTAESANWTSGSITLKCEDSDARGAAHTYSLEYQNENGIWTNTNDAAANNIAASADGFAHLTDNTFWSRLGGIPPVEYRVKDENGRVSAGCVTRNRHGLFVGVGHYSAAYQAKITIQRGCPLSDLPEIDGNTRRYSNLTRSRGGFMVTDLIETDAKVEMVDGAFVELAEKTIPGDLCLFYASTHGDFNGSEAVLRLYDDDYNDSRLRASIDLLSANDAAVICVLAACCSEAMVRQSTANVAVIAAANYKGSTTALFDEILWDYGWNDGWAGNGTNVTFGELADYVETRYNAIFNGITLNGPYGPETWNVQIDNFPLLAKIMAGTRGTYVNQSVPAVPSNINATKAIHRDKIVVSWDGDSDTDNYFIFYGGTGGGSYKDFIETSAISRNRFEITFKTNDYECVEQSSENAPVPFMIRAFNGAGVSTSVAQGWIYIPSIAPVPTIEWLNQYSTIAATANGDVATAAAMTAANGCRTVGECYALGINPEDPNDDLKISHFEMKDGKPVITLNHTEDGSGNSFTPRVKTLGKENLSDAEWREVPENGDPAMRFFKVSVELP